MLGTVFTILREGRGGEKCNRGEEGGEKRGEEDGEEMDTDGGRRKEEGKGEERGKGKGMFSEHKPIMSNCITVDLSLVRIVNKSSRLYVKKSTSMCTVLRDFLA